MSRDDIDMIKTKKHLTTIKNSDMIHSGHEKTPITAATVLGFPR